MGVKRTFTSEAEIAAYKLGYGDGIDLAVAVAKGAAAVAQVTGIGGDAAVGALTGLAATLEEKGRL